MRMIRFNLLSADLGLRYEAGRFLKTVRDAETTSNRDHLKASQRFLNALGARMGQPRPVDLFHEKFQSLLVQRNIVHHLTNSADKVQKTENYDSRSLSEAILTGLKTVLTPNTPSGKRLLKIREYLGDRLTGAGNLLLRLEGMKNRIMALEEESQQTRVDQKIFARIEDLQRSHESLCRKFQSVSAEETDSLSEEVRSLFLRANVLKEELLIHPDLREAYYSHLIGEVEGGSPRAIDDIRRLQEDDRRRFPENLMIVESSPGEILQDYLRLFNFSKGSEEEEKELAQIIGTRPSTILQWGSQEKIETPKIPNSIGNVIHLYRYLVEEAVRRDAFWGREGEPVLLPDPMELLRLAYGRWAEPFFAEISSREPKTIVVVVPEEFAAYSYDRMFYGQMVRAALEILKERGQMNPQEISSLIREIFPKGIVGRTYSRHGEGEVAPDRRHWRSRESERRLMNLLMGKGGDAFDFFLEAKSFIDQLGERSLWKVRVQSAGEVAKSFNGPTSTPSLSTDQFPLKYLEDLTLLLSHIRCRLDFLEAVQERDRSTSFEIKRGRQAEIRTLGELYQVLEDFEKRHRRIVSRFQESHENPKSVPFNAPEFYRRLILFARTVIEHIPIEGKFSLDSLTIRYRVVSPEPSGNGVSPSSVHFEREHGSLYDVSVISDRFTQYRFGMMGPAVRRDLLCGRILEEILRTKGIFSSTEIPSIAARQVARGASRHQELLVLLLQDLKKFEQNPLPLSQLHPSHPDVLAIYERADRQREFVRREDPPPQRWLRRRLEDFLWNRFGVPPTHLEAYQTVVFKYFEINPDYKNEFKEECLEKAIALGLKIPNGAAKALFLEFFYSLGFPIGDKVPWEETDSEIKASPGEASQNSFLPDLPHFPSRCSLIISDFIGEQKGGDLLEESLKGMLLQITGLFLESLAEGKGINRETVKERIQEILAERKRFLTDAPGEETAFQSAGIAFFETLQRYLRRIDSFAGKNGGTLGRQAIREIVLEMILSESTSNPAEVIVKILRHKKIPNPSPESNAFRETYEAVREWFKEAAQQTGKNQSDFKGLLEILEEKQPKEDLGRLLFEQGKDLLPSHFQGIQTMDEWEKTLEDHRLEMTLFQPEQRFEIARRWRKLKPLLKAALPENSVLPPAPLSGENGQKTTVKLPAPLWNPEDFTYSSLEAFKSFLRFVTKVAGGGRPGESVCLLFYLTEEGPRVVRVDTEVGRYWEKAHQQLQEKIGHLQKSDEMTGHHERQEEMKAPWRQLQAEFPGVFSGPFRFKDLNSGETVEILSTHVRPILNWEAIDSERFNWLLQLEEGDLSYPDVRFIEALTLYLPLSDDAKIEFDLLREEWNVQLSRKKVRQSLNRFFEKHRGTLEQYRTYHSNMGPFHFSFVGNAELVALAEEDPVRRNRFVKVFELLGSHPDLPSSLVKHLQCAIRELEGKSSPSREDYVALLNAFSEFWPDAMEMEFRRIRAFLPQEEEFQDLREAPELVFATTQDLFIFQHEMRAAIEKAEIELRTAGEHPGRDSGKGIKDEMDRIRRSKKFYGSILKILEEHDLEPIHRILYLLLYPGLAELSLGPGLDALISRLMSRLFSLKNREEAMREFYQSYLRMRPEILWRMEEKKGEKGFQQLGNGLPGQLPPRYRLSEEFPEIESLSFLESDRFLEKLRGELDRKRVSDSDGEGFRWLAFQYLLLAYSDLQEIHPLLVILFINFNFPSLQNPLVDLMRECMASPDSLKEIIPHIREEIVTIYRQLRHRLKIPVAKSD